MSRENVELVRRGYEALGRGDMEAFDALLREHLGPGFQLHSYWLGREYHGMQGMRDYLSDIAAAFEGYLPEPEEVIDLGDDVVVVTRASARGSGSGVPVAQVFATVWTFDGDKLIYGKTYPSRTEALEAVGLR